MKRLPALLVACVVLAAGCGQSRDYDGAAPSSAEDGADAVDEGTTPTTEAAAPATTAPDGDVAATVEFADGTSVELLHGATNEITGPTQDNQEFVDLVYGGQVPPTFQQIVLSQRVVEAVMDNELTRAGVEVSDENRTEAQEVLSLDLQNLLSAAEDADPAADAERLISEVPYLPFIVGLQARQIALSGHLAAAGEEGSGDPCARHVLVETEDEAQAVLEELQGGADFAQMAAERSIDPSAATNGGDLGCGPAANYVPPFAEAVTDAPVGELVGPVQTDFGYHVIIVDRYEVNGDALAEEAITDGLRSASVTVDDRVGAWSVDQLTIVPSGG